MTNKERTLNILHFKPADRLPAVHFGYWKELLLEWAEMGILTKEEALNFKWNTKAEEKLNKLIGWDFGWDRTFGSQYIKLSPQFEEKVIETLPDGTLRVQNSLGLIERIRPGVTSIPAEDDYILKSRKDFEQLYLPKMQFTKDRIDFKALEQFDKNRDPDIPYGIRVGSILGDIRDMTSVVGMSYLMYDEDETLFADIVDTYADMQYNCVKAILETGVRFDFAHFWEDICFKNGPLISPQIFDELCAKHYKKRTDLLRQYGIDIVSLDCDGVIEKLMPTWVDNGVNTMNPIEVGVWGDQFEAARNRFGNRVLGVGGMDKRVFLADKSAVDKELERLRRLVALGGFIPCPDHRLMPGTKIELVQYYAEEIKKIKL